MNRRIEGRERRAAMGGDGDEERGLVLPEGRGGKEERKGNFATESKCTERVWHARGLWRA
jgi:hypothetical protein